MSIDWGHNMKKGDQLKEKIQRLNDYDDDQSIEYENMQSN